MKKTHSFMMAGTVILVCLAMALIPITAQAECTAFIQAALESLADSCEEAGGSTACIASSVAINGDGGSTAAGSIVGLSNIETIQTINDLEADTFGLSMMNVPANVPLALDANGLRYVLVGDVTVENLVDPATAYSPVEAVPVTAIVASNLRASASTNGSVVDSVPPGTELPAFATNSGGDWLQVLFEGSDVWISSTVITPGGDLSTLPVFDGSTQSLMQSIRLMTDSSTPGCVGQPPAALIVQGTEDFGATITVNGVDIRVAGTIALQNVVDEAGNTRLQLSVLSGGAQSDGLSVPAGFTMSIALNAEMMATGAVWQNLVPMTGNQLAFFSPLEALPSELFFSPIEMPTQEQITQVLSSINSGGRAQTVSGALDCTGFRATSPTATMGNGPEVPFFWDGLANAEGYRLNFFDESGASIASFDLSNLSTTFVVNTTPDAIGAGTNFSWNVDALVGGQVACTTGRVSVLRDAVQQFVEDDNAVNNNSGGDGGGGSAPAQPTPTACPWESC